VVPGGCGDTHFGSESHLNDEPWLRDVNNKRVMAQLALGQQNQSIRKGSRDDGNLLARLLADCLLLCVECVGAVALRGEGPRRSLWLPLRLGTTERAPHPLA